MITPLIDPDVSWPPLPVGGITIVGIPGDATVSLTGPSLGGEDPGGPQREISRGGSYVRFNDLGLIEAHVEPGDEEDFSPIIDQLRTITASTQ